MQNDDGHKRITRGEGFEIMGGSEKTHGVMQEAAMKTAEKLARKGKTIATANPRELAELLRENTPRA